VGEVWFSVRGTEVKAAEAPDEASRQRRLGEGYANCEEAEIDLHVVWVCQEVSAQTAEKAVVSLNCQS